MSARTCKCERRDERSHACTSARKYARTRGLATLQRAGLAPAFVHFSARTHKLTVVAPRRLSPNWFASRGPCCCNGNGIVDPRKACFD
eukprot:3422675-Alexandrium_andersonii.AAC.1